mmetsp:Transcript_7383/g.10704  ORF Transcript_7383/g.10704 Transcript_7383/m.10704 type:complete len:111 (+) Transcript_7383:410-742(+)
MRTSRGAPTEQLHGRRAAAVAHAHSEGMGAYSSVIEQRLIRAEFERLLPARRCTPAQRSCAASVLQGSGDEPSLGADAVVHPSRRLGCFCSEVDYHASVQRSSAWLSPCD